MKGTIMYNEGNTDFFDSEFEKLLNMIESAPIDDDEYCEIMKEVFLSCSTNN